MGNDRQFIEAEDLPFRLIDIPIGSAPPPPSSSFSMHKRHAPPIPPPRVEGYDAPPSLLPPPSVPKRYDEPIVTVPPRSDLLPIPIAPPRSDLPKIELNKKSKRRKKHHLPKLACCAIS